MGHRFSWWAYVLFLTLVSAVFLSGGFFYVVFPERVRKRARLERRESFPPNLFPWVNVPVNVKSTLFVLITRVLGFLYLLVGALIVWFLFLVLSGRATVS